jgi:hypothetical protein
MASSDSQATVSDVRNLILIADAAAAAEQSRAANGPVGTGFKKFKNRPEVKGEAKKGVNKFLLRRRQVGYIS